MADGRARSRTDLTRVTRNPLLEDTGRGNPDDLTGNVLAERYHLLGVIGQGGMGLVYLTEHVDIGKRVAVKVLDPRRAGNANLRERFLREAKAISQVDHENIVQVLDYGETPNDSVFIAMELLEGETLADLIDREAPLPWPRARRVMLGLLRALHSAHEAGILHRDVKSDNCFRIKRGANRDFMKVLDFGLAKVTGDESDPGGSLTEAGTVFGTPEYMSPEQARGEPVHARTDIYAAGIVLYELCTGQVPFTGDNFLQVLTQQSRMDPPLPSEIAPNAQVPEEVEAIIMKAIAKNPAERFQSVRAFAEAVARRKPAVPVARPAEPAAAGRSMSADRERLYVGLIFFLGSTTLMLTLALVLALSMNM